MLWVPGREALNIKSISCSAQFVNLENISHPRLLFFNSTHKTKTGTANRWETINSNPPRPIKLSSQSTVDDGPIRNPEQQSDHIYNTLFCRCTALVQLLLAMSNCSIMQSQKHFPWAKPAYFDFSSSNFIV
jgi:hypothetical protein